MPPTSRPSRPHADVRAQCCLFWVSSGCLSGRLLSPRRAIDCTTTLKELLDNSGARSPQLLPPPFAPPPVHSFTPLSFCAASFSVATSTAGRSSVVSFMIRLVKQPTEQQLSSRTGSPNNVYNCAGAPRRASYAAASECATVDGVSYVCARFVRRFDVLKVHSESRAFLNKIY